MTTPVKQMPIAPEDYYHSAEAIALFLEEMGMVKVQEPASPVPAFDDANYQFNDFAFGGEAASDNFNRKAFPELDA